MKISYSENFKFIYL